MSRIKTVGKLLCWLLNILLVLLLCCNVYTIIMRQTKGVLQPDVLGWSCAVVVSGSMAPEISVNDLVLVREQESYYPGDVISFESGSSVVTHRVLQQVPGGYVTQGDANNTPDLEPVLKEKVIGKVCFVVPQIGLLIHYLQSPLGMTCLVLIGFLIIEIPYLIEKDRKEKGVHGKHEIFEPRQKTK